MIGHICDEATKALIVVAQIYSNVILNTISAVLWGLFLTKTGIVTYVDKSKDT